MTILAINPNIVTVIHSYIVPKEKQKQLIDKLCEAIEKYGQEMAGHIASNVHVSLDNTHASYPQCDHAQSKTLFDDPDVLAKTLAWFASYVTDATFQDFKMYDLVFAKSYQ